MKCPVCGGAELVHDTRAISYEYKGNQTQIDSVTGDFCPMCEESILSEKEGDRVMREMKLFIKKVNSSAYDPSFIATVRKKLGLDQGQAADVFGGGKNAFSRYENGNIQPPVALIKLLKLLDGHPELLSEIR